MWDDGGGTYTKGAVPNQLGGNTKGTRDTEEDGVEVLLGETVARHASVHLQDISSQLTKSKGHRSGRRRWAKGLIT